MRQQMEITMLILFLCCRLLTFTVQGQFESGFISVDCGLAQGSSYSDATTGLRYSSDEEYVDTGINSNISPDFMSNISLPRHMSSVRSFPQGINNCYTFKPDQVVAAKDNKYLIRAIFMYGNYDSKNQTPEFGLYLDVNEWDTVKLENASVIVIKEIIHMPTSDYIHVCLVNTGSGTPFRSALELRKLDNSTYVTFSGSLVLRRRLDFGSTTNTQYRYDDDVYDRIWEPAGEIANMESVGVLNTSTTDLLGPDIYKAPYAVMRTAVRPVNGSRFDYNYIPLDPSKGFYFYMYFAEVEVIQSNQYREFNISVNDKQFVPYKNITYLNALTLFSGGAEYATEGTFHLSLYSTDDSTLPPILNAFEIYEVKNFPHSPTHQIEVDAMRLIKSTYGVDKNWQGDPCVPRNYLWDGIICRYNGENSPTIISLNLSSSGLSGNIASSLSNLKSLQSLDLSNNSLTGPVPDFLGQMSLLLRINLSRNKLSGSVPAALIEKINNGSLQSFSVDGNPKLCDTTTSTCKKKKKNVIIPVVVSVVSCLVLVSAMTILWIFTRRKQQGTLSLGKPKQENEAIEPKARQFTFSEVENITSNFTRVLGKGGFGTVYGGNLEDGTQVAVKMLSLSSTQGSKEFRAEAQLLTRVHHKNLVSFVGFCNEGERMGLIYEYMAKGNLQDHLSEKIADVLSWGQRIRIAVDAAQGLEYLHNGCKPPIIHRDVKTSNILLDDEMQAKVSDFGTSKFMPPNGGSHVTTRVIGTPGYLDPEYYESNWLNKKSDVYSFGILLLEIISGRSVIAKGHENPYIVQWVKPMLERGEITNIIDSRLKGEFDINSVRKALETAMACAAPYSIHRPTMSYVLRELIECLEMEIASERILEMNKDHTPTCSNSAVIDSETSIVSEHVGV